MFYLYTTFFLKSFSNIVPSLALAITFFHNDISSLFLVWLPSPFFCHSSFLTPAVWNYLFSLPSMPLHILFPLLGTCFCCCSSLSHCLAGSPISPVRSCFLESAPDPSSSSVFPQHPIEAAKITVLYCVTPHLTVSSVRTQVDFRFFLSTLCTEYSDVSMERERKLKLNSLTWEGMCLVVLNTIEWIQLPQQFCRNMLLSPSYSSENKLI